jgi:hypothetical protein
VLMCKAFHELTSASSSADPVLQLVAAKRNMPLPVPWAKSKAKWDVTKARSSPALSRCGLPSSITRRLRIPVLASRSVSMCLMSSLPRNARVSQVSMWMSCTIALSL